MNKILEQQLQVELGDDYDNCRFQASNFVKHLIGRSYWGKNKSQLINNEGGVAGLVNTALLYIVESDGNIAGGFRELTAMLSKEYSPQYNGSNREQAVTFNHSQWLPLESLDDDKYPLPQSLLGDSREPIQGLISDVDTEPTHPLIENDEDAALLYRTMASIGGVQNSLREAIDLLDWEYRRGYNAYYRVRHNRDNAAKRG